MKELKQVYEWTNRPNAEHESICMMTVDDIDLEDVQWYRVHYTNEKTQEIEWIGFFKVLAEAKRCYKIAIKKMKKNYFAQEVI